ncbi:nuclear speckle splicing regulatory protein 1 isoform X2 [Rhinatrema bivittatum]|uniref:nuclear speckle splicing regulatory protein 1 isoform X2 n=1 Tax=Rhinatrema bivittatum TaxID=194408 RepID=UPI00112C65A5|nr:nuclear speckle splicing regulatory protein 1 isoform X2 [Rhinatrema bivittatum]
MAAPKKQYGLILPKKAQQRLSGLPRHAAFADDSDEEVSVGESLQKEALKKRVMKQTKLEMQKALEEDATVYEYDSIYGDLQLKKEESDSKLLSSKDKKPRYIQSLMKAVEMRKKEQERRMERKIQKEREMEGEEFKEKEAFVTSAYKKKLQERAEEDEREKREAALEASLDVTKQRDLSGFYRHLLNQTVGEEQTPECSLREVRVKEEKVKGYADEPSQRSKSPGEIKGPRAAVKQENPDADSDLGGDSSSDAEEKDVCKATQALASKKESRVSSDEDSRIRRSQSKESQKKSHRKGDDGVDPGERAEGEREQHWVQSEKDHNKEKGERSKKREEQKAGQRERDRSEKEQRRETDRNTKDGRSRDRNEKHRDREGERSEKYRERAPPAKDEKRERSERARDGEERSSLPLENESQSGRGREETVENEQKPESCAEGTGLPEAKRKGAEEGAGLTEGAPARVSKFAKRSSEETVLSARDRYLARQMARVSAKPYVEREED